MSAASTTIDFIRQIFRGSQYERPPYVPLSSGGYYGVGAGAPYFSYNLQQGSIQGLSDALRLDTDLVNKYIDYEDQDDSPLISSALDIYADDSTQNSHKNNKVAWTVCKDEQVRAEIDYMLDKVCNIEDRSWGEMRTLCKYGNYFEEFVVKDGAGLVAVNSLPPPTMRRIEIPQEIGNPSRDPQKWEDALGFIYDPKGMFSLKTSDFIGELEFRSTGVKPPNFDQVQGVGVFEGWEVNHMRLHGKNASSIYGTGIGDPARWIFKRLLLLEDAVIMYRLSRAPSRYAFYVDVSKIPPNETQSYLKNVAQSLKKKKIVNPNTGKMDMRFDVLGNMDDFFLPSRDGKDSTRVEALTGPTYTNMDDIMFFENKLFAALKIPKPFLGYEESTAKTHLSAEDARFARTVLRVQRAYRNGLKKRGRVHLAAKGINPGSVDFDIEMQIPSAIFELAQLEIQKAELELVEAFKGITGYRWGLANIMGFSESQIAEMELKRRKEESGEPLEVEGKFSGKIDDLASNRGVRTPSPLEASVWRNPEKYLLEKSAKETSLMKERIEELRSKNKSFDMRWSKIESFMREIKDSLISK